MGGPENPSDAAALLHHCSWLSSRSSEGRNLYCCCLIIASFFLASSSSLSLRNISSWAAMICNTNSQITFNWLRSDSKGISRKRHVEHTKTTAGHMSACHPESTCDVRDLQLKLLLITGDMVELKLIRLLSSSVKPTAWEGSYDDLTFMLPCRIIRKSACQW